MAIDLSERNSDIQDVMRWFEFDHLESPQREFSQQCHDLAVNMVSDLPDSTQLLNGLNKLLEAKDCFVRATVRHAENEQVPEEEPAPPMEEQATEAPVDQGVEYGEDLLDEPTVDQQIAEQTGTDAP